MGTGLALVGDTTREAVYYAVMIDGLSPHRASELFSIPETHVRRFVHEVEEENSRQHQSEAAAIRQLSRHRYERIFRNGAEAFEKSGTPKRKNVKKKWSEDGGVSADGAAIGGGSGESTEETEEERIGDPRFLNVQLAAVKEIGNLYGAEAPKTTIALSRTTHDVYIEMMNLPEEELQRQATLALLEQQKVLLFDQEPHKEPIACLRSSPVMNPAPNPEPPIFPVPASPVLPEPTSDSCNSPVPTESASESKNAIASPETTIASE